MVRDETNATRWERQRRWIMGVSVLLFLSPLTLVFQLSGDLGFCGRWCPRMFFVWRQGMAVDAYGAAWLRSWLGVVLVLGILFTTLLFGRLWCSHLCPVGGCLELASRLVPRRLQLDYSALPAPAFRYAYLAVYLAAPLLGLGSLCCSYCNFAAVPHVVGALFSRADLVYFLRVQGLINLALVAILGPLAVGGRAYCNLLCPIGALDGLAARFGLRFGRRLRLDATRCTGCGECLAHCPTWAIDISATPRVDQLSCLPCRRCEAVCPHGAVFYGAPRE